MDDEDIRQLIAKLRTMLLANGFGWLVDEVEAELYPTVAPRTRALALIDAAEGVTVDLADAELRTLEILEVESIEFKPDEEDQPDRDVPAGQASRGDASADDELLHGAERRAKLERLAEQRFAFRALRRRLDGDQ